MTSIQFTTSGWSYRDWIGNESPEGTPSGKFLNHFSRRFTCVEIPGTCYAIPGEKMVAGWDANTPEGFIFLPKMPKSIVHAGKDARPDPERILNLNHVRQDLELFLERVSALGPKLGCRLVFSKKNASTVVRRSSSASESGGEDFLSALTQR